MMWNELLPFSMVTLRAALIASSACHGNSSLASPPNVAVGAVLGGVAGESTEGVDERRGRSSTGSVAAACARSVATSSVPDALGGGF